MFRSKYADHWIDFSLIFLALFGIVMIGSASVGTVGSIVDDVEIGPSYPIVNMIKQFVYVIVGFFVNWFLRRYFRTSFLNRRLVHLGYFGLLGLMLACLAFPEINGAKAWIHLGPATVQPAEFAKIVLILFLAYYLVDVPRSMKISPNLSTEVRKHYQWIKFRYCVLRPLVWSIVLFAVCFILQNDLGTSLIIAGVVATVFFCANNPYYVDVHKVLLILLGILIGVILLWTLMAKISGSGGPLSLLKDYQIARFEAWLHPAGDPLGTSYHQMNGLIAYSKNGLFGLGFGKSTQKYGYIPESASDFISCIIFEELGIIGLALFMVPYTIIIYRLFNYGYQVKDGRAKLILFGVASYFFLHLLFNVGGVTCLIPMTGVPLLCVSAGGSSTVSAFMALGICQAVIKKYNRSLVNQHA